MLSDYSLKEFNPAQYLDGYVWEMFMPKRNVAEFLRSLDEFDVYFNLCDGSVEREDYSGLDVVRALEELGLPFTGAESHFYDPSRQMMQAAAEMNQIGFARGVNISDLGGLEAQVEGLRFPLMVKHPNSFASTGMTRNSRVENFTTLRRQVSRICKRFGSARVEEFIDGREFTTLVADNPDDLGDPFVYPPAELIMPDGETFLHSRVKWKEWVYLKPVRDETLESDLMDISRRLYLALDGTGYARCDIRMQQAGELVMIEINPNCGVLFKPKDLGPADVMMEYDAEGHAGFLERIFRSAEIRQQERMVRYAPRNEVANAHLYSFR